jgi:tetratricopeptide (TPR) repeat protein
MTFRGAARRFYDRSTARAWAATAFVVLLLAVQTASAQRPQAPSGPVDRARTAILHGEYAEAESILTPLASRTNPNEATLELGLLLRHLGRRAEADRWLEAVVSATRGATVADLVRIGRAAHALGQFRIANEAFQDAAEKAPTDTALNLAWGALFLGAHNRAEAAKSFQTVIENDAKSAAGHYGLAAALAEDSPPPALKAAQAAVELDPSFVPAHLLIAELLVDRSERDEARKSIERALAVNPSSFEAHALTGAIAYLEDRHADFQNEVNFVLKINPRYGEVYRIAGDHAARAYRFDEAVKLTRQAIEIDPDNMRAHADLGLHLLRTGDEPAARRSLELAFKADPFDTITYNLLTMLDTLDKFETFRDGLVMLRLHPDEAPVIREYAMPLAQDAFAKLSARYKFTPRGPILIEIFPKHDDFAVRNLGLPGMIGALGACFGRVVTLDSPRARPPGSFNWGATLWHEITHVITLGMSNNRAPRWVSEGISVFEERRAAPEWGREYEVSFAQALHGKKILTLKDLNAGFTDPQTINLAYYQSSLLIEHIVNTYGEPALHKLVRAYGEGVEGEEALKRGLGVGLEELEAAFLKTLDKQFGSLAAALEPPSGLKAAMSDMNRAAELAKEHPGSFLAQLTLGRLLAEDNKLDEAMSALEKASQLVPMATGEESPRAMMASIALKQKNQARAIAELEALLQHDDSDLESARQLVALLSESPNPDRAKLTAAYEKVVAIDPFDSTIHAALGRLLLERREYPKAIRELRASLASGPADRAAVHCDLAEAYLGAKQPDQAKRQTLAALEIAPGYERAQELLLKLVESQ